MRASRERAVSLSSAEMNGSWEAVRSRVLWAAGLRDLPDAAPGRGCTGHAFNDANHCDATTMLGEVSHDTNDGSVKGIAVGNLLGPGIEIASLPELGPGGSWSTCTNGCHLEPPQDVRALTPPPKCGSYTPAPRTAHLSTAHLRTAHLRSPLRGVLQPAAAHCTPRTARVCMVHRACTRVWAARQVAHVHSRGAQP